MRVSKRGISPVIATLLLILIAVAAGVAVYMYVTSWIGSSTSTSAVAQSEIQIDTADLDATSNTLTVWVRNVGGTTANITAVYLLDSSGAIVMSDTSISQDEMSNYQLSPGEVGKYTGSVSGVQSGYSYVIKVVCSDGASTTYTVKAHS